MGVYRGEAEGGCAPPAPTGSNEPLRRTGIDRRLFAVAIACGLQPGVARAAAKECRFEYAGGKIEPTFVSFSTLNADFPLPSIGNDLANPKMAARACTLSVRCQYRSAPKLGDFKIGYHLDVDFSEFAGGLPAADARGDGHNVRVVFMVGEALHEIVRPKPARPTRPTDDEQKALDLWKKSRTLVTPASTRAHLDGGDASIPVTSAYHAWLAEGVSTGVLQLAMADNANRIVCTHRFDAKLLRRLEADLALALAQLRATHAAGMCRPTGVAVCYLTTAVVESMGLEDDCWELRTLRHFRERLNASIGGRRLVEDYERRSPSIVAALSLRPDAASIWSRAYLTGILPASIAASLGAGGLATRIYHRMTDGLERLSRRSDSTSPGAAA